MKNKNGFTLVELLVVISIILILGLIVTPKIIKTIENNKLKIYKEQEKRLEEAGLKYIQNKYISENESEIKITKQELKSTCRLATPYNPDVAMVLPTWEEFTNECA